MNSRLVLEHFNDPRSLTAGYYLHENGRIGGGGQAEVYAGSRKGENDALAVKVMQHDPANEQATMLFREEAAIMAELGDHPNIVSIHHSGSFDARTKHERAHNLPATHYLYTVMDKGHATLADEISQAQTTELGRIPPEIATQYVLNVVAAVGHAHGERRNGNREQGRLHRDIKPANILMFTPREADRPLEARLTDFGIARRGYHAPDDITETHIGAGTWLYADPRQFYEGGALYANDQYMTAATAWHAVTGRPLFSEYRHDLVNLQQAHLYAEPTVAPLMVDRRVDHIAEAVQQQLLRALHKDHTQRYATMAEFGDALLEAVSQGASLQKRNQSIHPLGNLLGWSVPLGRPEHAAYITATKQRYDIVPEQPGSRRRFLLAGGAAAMAVAGGAGWLLHNRNGPNTSGEKPHVPYEQLLKEAFASKPPTLPELSAAEKVHTKESIAAVHGIIIKYLKKQADMTSGDQDSMQRLISALGTYDAGQAYDLWKWLEPKGFLSSDTASKADVQAWAAATLVAGKPGEMEAVLRGKTWADGGLLSDGSYTEIDTIRACNRGVLGCALARIRPGAVRKVVDTYSGDDPTAGGYDAALRLALNPTDPEAERKLDLLGFEQATAVARTLAYENPALLIRNMTAQRKDWTLNATRFGRALIPLIDTRPDYVGGVVRSKDLDSNVTPFDRSVTLEVGLRCAVKHPETTQDILQQRLGDVPKSAEAMLAMAMVGYKPAIAQAIRQDQPDNSLLALALDATDAVARQKAVMKLEAELARDFEDRMGKQPTLSHAALLAVAFMVGQQRRLNIRS